MAKHCEKIENACEVGIFGDYSYCTCDCELCKKRVLSRFRANPHDVRVALRWIPNIGEWSATVSHRYNNTVKHTASSSIAVRALDEALNDAELANVRGIDLDMMEVYEHPFKTTKR